MIIAINRELGVAYFSNEVKALAQKTELSEVEVKAGQSARVLSGDWEVFPAMKVYSNRGGDRSNFKKREDV